MVTLWVVINCPYNTSHQTVFFSVLYVGNYQRLKNVDCDKSCGNRSCIYLSLRTNCMLEIGFFLPEWKLMKLLLFSFAEIFQPGVKWTKTFLTWDLSFKFWINHSMKRFNKMEISVISTFATGKLQLWLTITIENYERKFKFRQSEKNHGGMKVVDNQEALIAPLWLQYKAALWKRVSLANGPIRSCSSCLAIVLLQGSNF